MTDSNPYDFLSGDAPTNGASPERSDHSKSAFEENAPDATVPRADSVAALEARESHEPSGPNGSNGGAAYDFSTDYNGDIATVPELAPLAEPQSAPDAAFTSTETTPVGLDSEREILAEPIDPNARPHDEQDLFEHLGELRVRMLRAISYVMVAAAVTWQFTAQIQDFLLEPIQKILKRHNISDTVTTTEPMQAFTTYFQLSLVAAIIIASPLILWEMWRFIEPALTHKEKRYSSFLVPFSTALFAAGCALGFFTSPLFFNFFLAFVPPGVTVLWTYSSVVVLLGKMLLVFGVCFQVPVIVIFLNKTGIVQRNVFIDYWRHVVVGIFVVVSVLTPTWDPFTLMICAVPPCLLYALSIWLIRWL
jgi:sec-independent protein translocase protein TatC